MSKDDTHYVSPHCVRPHFVRCLAVGDAHIMTSNIDEINAAIDRILYFIQKYSPSFVVLLGDQLHTHEKVHVIPFKTLTEMITKISSVVQLFVLIGNHDYINNQQFLTDNHAYNAFKTMKNVTICDSPVKHTVDGYNFLFVPYVPPGRFHEAISGSDIPIPNVIFCHQEFRGCMLNPVVASIEGDEIPSNFQLIVSGHIHNEQWVGNNLYYPGSLLQHSYGEKAKKIVPLITVDSTGPTIKRLLVNNIQKHILYKSIEEITDYPLPEGIEQQNIKIVIKGIYGQFHAFKKTEKYKELITAGVKISFIPIESKVDYQLTTQKKSVMEILETMISKESANVVAAFETLKKSI